MRLLLLFFSICPILVQHNNYQQSSDKLVYLGDGYNRTLNSREAHAEYGIRFFSYHWALLGAWCYWVSAGTGWPGVSVL